MEKSMEHIFQRSYHRESLFETFEIMKKIILVLVISSLLSCKGEGSGMRAIYCITLTLGPSPVNRRGK